MCERQIPGMPSDSDIKSFISSSFRSVWAIDLIQFLRSEPARTHSRDELIDALRASDSVVGQCMESLLAAGLITLTDEGQVGLRTSDPRTAEMIAASIDFYSKSPDKVRRIIVSNTVPGITAFADAFRLRKD